MSHHIYQTKGFVLGSSVFGEADRLVHVFTEDLGLVSAVAKSVRSVKGKLRYSLQDGAFSRVNLVRGKEVWRVTDAEELSRISFAESPETARTIAGIFSFVRRFIHGEGREEGVYEALSESFSFLTYEQSVEEITREEQNNLLLLAMWRILYALGYVEEGEYIQGEINKNILSEFSKKRTQVLHKINEAMKDSHL